MPCPSASEPQTEPGTKKCAQCHARKSLEDFKVSKKTGTLGPRCKPCMEQDAARQREKRQEKKRMLVEIMSDEDDEPEQVWTATNWRNFVKEVEKRHKLTKTPDPEAFTGLLMAEVDCSTILEPSQTNKVKAQTIADKLGDVMGLHWTYVPIQPIFICLH